jgi:cytochrome c556
MAVVVAAGVGSAGMALAQGNVVAERRAGFREMGTQMEAIAAIVQSRGDQRQIAARIDQMLPFFQSLPNRVPADSLTPPTARGTQDGQARALAEQTFGDWNASAAASASLDCWQNSKTMSV